MGPSMGMTNPVFLADVNNLPPSPGKFSEVSSRFTENDDDISWTRQSDSGTVMSMSDSDY